MKMYPDLDLYKTYKKFMKKPPFSIGFFDYTKRFTLERLNFAINLCDRWGLAIDIGGGNGHYLSALTAKFTQNILVEPYHYETHKNLSQVFSNLVVENKLIEDYKAKELADFILLADVYEHIENIESFVCKINNLQQIGGVVYIITPNALHCGPATESGLHYTRHPLGHQKHYTSREIISCLENAGNQLENLWYEESPLRQFVKRIYFAINRRNQKWNSVLLFKLIKPLLLLTTYIPLRLLGLLVYFSEKKNSYNVFSTLAQDLVFKKVKNI
jgi:hypothetical protein